MTGVLLNPAQARALAAYAVPGRQLVVEQEADARVHGGPVTLTIVNAGVERVPIAELGLDGQPSWQADTP